jgi:hypothetical protein
MPAESRRVEREERVEAMGMEEGVGVGVGVGD